MQASIQADHLRRFAEAAEAVGDVPPFSVTAYQGTVDIRANRHLAVESDRIAAVDRLASTVGLPLAVEMTRASSRLYESVGLVDGVRWTVHTALATGLAVESPTRPRSGDIAYAARVMASVLDEVDGLTGLYVQLWDNQDAHVMIPDRQVPLALRQAMIAWIAGVLGLGIPSVSAGYYDASGRARGLSWSVFTPAESDLHRAVSA